MENSEDIKKISNGEWWIIKTDNYYRFIFLSCLLSFSLSILISLPFNFEISDIWWSYLPFHFIYLVFCSLTLIIFETLGRVVDNFISLELKQSIYKFYFRATVGLIFVFPLFLAYIFLKTSI